MTLAELPATEVARLFDLAPPSRRRLVPRDLSRPRAGRRSRPFDGDLLSAGRRRPLPLAPGGCGRGLAPLCRRAVAAQPCRRRRRDNPSHSGPRHPHGRSAADRCAAPPLAKRRQPRRLVTGRLHGGARLRLLRLRIGPAGLRSRLAARRLLAVGLGESPHAGEAEVGMRHLARLHGGAEAAFGVAAMNPARF